MKDWLEDGYPDYLPSNSRVPAQDGETIGDQEASSRTPRDDAAHAPLPGLRHRQRELGYHVIGWAAFVIDDVGVDRGSSTTSSPATS